MRSSIDAPGRLAPSALPLPSTLALTLALAMLAACGNDQPGPDLPPPGGSSGGSLSGGSVGDSGGSETGDDAGTADDEEGGSGGRDEPPTVTDPVNGLQWFDTGLDGDLLAAVDTCAAATHDGQTDWRLPPIQAHFVHVTDCELQSQGSCLLSDPDCLDTTCAEPLLNCPTCIDPATLCFFDPDLWGVPCEPFAARYWSASACTDCLDGEQWVYDFGLPQPVVQFPDQIASIRCVRPI